MARSVAGSRLPRRVVVVGGATSVVALWGSGCGADDVSDGAATGSSDGGTQGSTTNIGDTGSTAAVDGSSGGMESSGSSSADGSSDGGSSDGADSSSSTGEQACDTDGWLAGGTASMAGDYPDPFDDEPNPSCVVVASQTCGPCWVPGPIRKDVTAGVVGLPVRLSFRVLYEGTCEPVGGAVVDVWFTDIDGSYSGDTPSAICSNGNAEVIPLDFHRGQQSTDSEGKVDFDAVFPSWYPGRSPHLHVLFIVDGVQHQVTQFYFDDALSDSIYARHRDYSHRPVKDTANAQDGPFDPAAPNLMSTRKTYDCAMQAWATVLIPDLPVPVNC